MRVTATFLGLALLGVASSVAAAAEVNATSVSPDRHAWFKGLTQPDTGASCCDISDCRRTTADWRNGQWWATVDGQWTPIPQSKVLQNKPSIDGDAYVCSGLSRTIFCFVKPSMAM